MSKSNTPGTKRPPITPFPCPLLYMSMVGFTVIIQLNMSKSNTPGTNRPPITPFLCPLLYMSMVGFLKKIIEHFRLFILLNYWLSNLLTMSLLNENYSRNVLCRAY
jgi:hypothetical protein